MWHSTAVISTVPCSSSCSTRTSSRPTRCPSWGSSSEAGSAASSNWTPCSGPWSWSTSATRWPATSGWASAGKGPASSSSSRRRPRAAVSSSKCPPQPAGNSQLASSPTPASPETSSSPPARSSSRRTARSQRWSRCSPSSSSPCRKGLPTASAPAASTRRTKK